MAAQQARVLPLPTDARTVVGGVVALLVLLVVVTQWTGPKARLHRALQRLPDSVEAVALDTAPPVLSRLVDSLLQLPRRPLPDDLPAAADIVLAVNGTERRVSLVEPAAARAAGVTGPLVRGFTALGDADAITALQTAAAPPTDGIPAAFRRLAGEETGPGVALYLRRPFVARRLDPAVAPVVAVTAVVQAAGQHVRVRGLLESPVPWLGARGGAVLAEDLPGALVLLDGAPATELLPRELPPILEAVKTETGVGEEIDAAREAVADAPILLALFPAEGERVDVVLGTTVPVTRAAAVGDALRGVLEGRLRRAGAVTERVRAEGRTILHRRSSGGAAEAPGEPRPALLEFDREGWHVLRAPHGAGSTDVVVAARGGSILVGSSEFAVFQVAAAVRATPQSRVVRAAVNLAAARTLPVFNLLERGASPGLRAWLAVLENGRLTIDGTRGEPRFDLDIAFARPLDELPPLRGTGEPSR